MTKTLDTLGVKLKIKQSSLFDDYLSLYEEKILKKNQGKFRLLIITNQKVYELAQMYSARFHEAEVVAISYSNNFNTNAKFKDERITYYQFVSLSEMLSGSVDSGFFDVIIEHSENKKSHKTKIFKEYYGFLNSNGLFFIEELNSKFIPSLSDCDGDDVIDMLTKASNIKIASSEYKKNSDTFLVALAESCESISINGKLGIIEKNKSTLRALRNNEAIEYIFKGILTGETIYKTDISYLNWFNNNIISYPEKNASRYRKKFIIRDSYINKYQGVICESGQIVYQGGFLLPDSFRHQYQKGLLNSSKIKLLHENLYLVSGNSATNHLVGKYLYLDSEYQCHFGHFTSEVISRLWAWDLLKEQNPDLKVLIGLEKGRALPDFVIEVLDCYGINKDDIVTFDNCVSVESLYTASPYVSLRDHINPEVLPIWNRISENAINGTSGIKGNRLFIARPINGKRKCLNPDKLESLLKEFGFEFYNPENHSWLDQVKTFSQAEVVAGYAGSAIFNSIFSNSLKKMIIISSSSFDNFDEQFICETKDIKLYRFWGDSIIEHKKGVWSTAAYHSDFNFNYERDELALIELLKNL